MLCALVFVRINCDVYFKNPCPEKLTNPILVQAVVEVAADD